MAPLDRFLAQLSRTNLAHHIKGKEHGIFCHVDWAAAMFRNLRQEKIYFRLDPRRVDSQCFIEELARWRKQ